MAILTPRGGDVYRQLVIDKVNSTVIERNELC